MANLQEFFEAEKAKVVLFKMHIVSNKKW